MAVNQLPAAKITMPMPLFREICPGCAGPTVRAYCDACAADCRYVFDPCAACGLSRPVRACPRRASRWWVDGIVAPYAYCSPIKERIHALKFRGQRQLGRALGLLLAAALAPRCERIDGLVAVPLHTNRQRERGFNQAVEIARTLARELDLTLLLSGISRRRDTQPQAELSANDRARNLAQAFRVSRRVAGMRLLVVDDVITTGATVNALARDLLDQGAAEVGAAAIARTLD